MNLANLITSSRLLVTFGVIVCLEMISDVQNPEPALIWTAFGLFMYAACSDFADGWVARRYGQETQLGRVIDPFADKFLICGTMISMLQFSDYHLDYELGDSFSGNSLQSTIKHCREYDKQLTKGRRAHSVGSSKDALILVGRDSWTSFHRVPRSLNTSTKC